MPLAIEQAFILAAAPLAPEPGFAVETADQHFALINPLGPGGVYLDEPAQAVQRGIVDQRLKLCLRHIPRWPPKPASSHIGIVQRFGIGRRRAG